MWSAQRGQEAGKWLLGILLAVVLSFLCAVLFEGSITIGEKSMDPTIQSGDVVLINRLAYRLGTVRRGDLIAYRARESSDSAYHIKRVIGLPGETIAIKEGLIMINGETYLEKLELPNISDAGIAADPIQLRNDEYFVLGDNRNNSEDSRFADVGNVKRSQLAGKVWFRIRPAGRTGFLS